MIIILLPNRSKLGNQSKSYALAYINTSQCHLHSTESKMNNPFPPPSNVMPRMNTPLPPSEKYLAVAELASWCMCLKLFEYARLAMNERDFTQELLDLCEKLSKKVNSATLALPYEMWREGGPFSVFEREELSKLLVSGWSHPPEMLQNCIKQLRDYIELLINQMMQLTFTYGDCGRRSRKYVELRAEVLLSSQYARLVTEILTSRMEPSESAAPAEAFFLRMLPRVCGFDFAETVLVPEVLAVNQWMW